MYRLILIYVMKEYFKWMTMVLKIRPGYNFRKIIFLMLISLFVNLGTFDIFKNFTGNKA